MKDEEYVFVERQETMKNLSEDASHDDGFSAIDEFIEDLSEQLWRLNCYIHENPELAFKEHKTHDALTAFMRSQNGWQVTPSAYGLETAWVAVYDNGRKGPAVSFNAEMGMHSQYVSPGTSYF